LCCSSGLRVGSSAKSHKLGVGPGGRDASEAARMKMLKMCKMMMSLLPGCVKMKLSARRACCAAMKSSV